MSHTLHLVERETDSLPLAMMELRHVRLIIAVLRFGSLTRAGEHLHLSQSALSHQLREIEDRLGTQLFLRVRKKLVPTALCQAILHPCREILRAFSTLEQHLHQETRRTPVIRITMESYTCYTWLPPILKVLERHHPQARVHIVSEASADVETALLDGIVDLAITTTESRRNDVRAHKLLRDEFLLITAPGNELSSKSVVAPSDMRGERLILSSPPAIDRFYHEFFSGSAFGPREIAVVELTDTLISLVAAGLGVALLPRFLVADAVRSNVISAIRLAGHCERQWLALTRSADRMSDEMETLIGLISARNPRLREDRAPGR